MTYQEAVEYLYTQTPLFQNVGQEAYKEGLYNTVTIDRYLGCPHKLYKTIHVAGTNGKGSVSHTLAAILQASGYKTGLYTSPHLTDFRERIRVNGKPVSPDFVVKFIEKNRDFLEPLHPSFFEVTTAMAFSWFAEQEVDIAVIETGLGGRLDCTNIIKPVLSIITNIGFDHTKFLGSTLPGIAFEKAGIIKKNVPVVIGEYTDETRPVFERKAEEVGTRIVFAQDDCKIISHKYVNPSKVVYETAELPQLESGLAGLCQDKNANTILTAVSELKRKKFDITEAAVRKGFKDVCRMTGLRGRWQLVRKKPDIICDTGHNSHGLKYIAQHLEELSSKPGFGQLRIVLGMVNDKDVSQVLAIMPRNARYYFTQASVKRALDASSLREMAREAGLTGRVYRTVAQAVSTAQREASANDLIFVGGSTFVVADLLTMREFFIQG
ncbi:MAG: bifunctional folylpolyglutamate synthase/dihydrofolate synthase [Bacteroidaceae bacterium]|nr:bifunctional folylpolyglutamate synthase/dihydrofolate synthase [Bacteroidaceae bacterium]